MPKDKMPKNKEMTPEEMRKEMEQMRKKMNGDIMQQGGRPTKGKTRGK